MGSLDSKAFANIESLPPRPPTPPREARHDRASVRTALASVDRQLNLQTPPSIYSPAESAVTHSGSAGQRKKVGFSARAEYKDPPVYAEGNGTKPHQPTPVSLPPSSSKPTKSILKVSTYSPSLLDPSSADPSNPNRPNENISTMLESAIQHLAGSNRDSKVDAYMVLTQALKTTDNLPDRAAMQQQIGFFTQCIQRDIMAKTPEGTPDSSLVNHALSLLATVIYFPSIASAIPHEFAVFIIDHCIRTFEDSSSPKELVRHLMQVVGHQRFSAKVMAADRVARLISSLHNIEEHLKGKSIIMARVLIYRQLLGNCRNHMVANPDWLLDLFTDMLSSLKDIRSAAIQLGLEAGFSAGKDKQLTRKVADIFSLMLEDKTYLKYYEERLELMVKDKGLSASVPRIWTAVLLLLRMPMDKWEASKNWLRIIQSCFNSSDLQTKTEANYAWGRLIYLAHFEERTFPKYVVTLRQPLETQLRRKPTSKKEEEIRRAVLGGICNLFYYEFKPTSNFSLLDAYWDNGVEPLLTKLLDPKPEDSQERIGEASKILSGLFDSTTKRVWKEERVTENVLVRPEELPPIDPKWLRRNATRVFALAGPILEQTFLALADNQSATFRLWETLVRSVASAASKEIKVSPDSASFVAHAFNILQRVWQQGLSTEDKLGDEPTVFLTAAKEFLDMMTRSLGLLPFTERNLSVDKHNCFVPNATPSSRSGKHQGPPKSPLHHLFSILSTLPPGVLDGSDFSQFMAEIFSPFFPGKDEQVDKNLAQELLSSIPMNALGPWGPWQLAAERVMKWLEPRDTPPQATGSSSQPLAGHDYREIVKILERGIRSTPNLPWDLWKGLFTCLSKRAQVETGDAGVAIAVFEPLSKVALDQFTAGSAAPVNAVKCVTEILSMATHPRDRQALDAARRRLWGTPSVGPKSSNFDTFDSLYKAVTTALECLYSDPNSTALELAMTLLEETGNFIARCNAELTGKAITALQDGVAYWIQDGQRRMGAQASASLSMVKSLWATISHAVIKLDNPDQQLVALQTLYCAAFKSSHRQIVNSAASLWNTLFKDAKDISYPEALQAILVSLQPHLDLVLPGLEAPETDPAEQPLSFVESQEEPSLPKVLPARSSRRNTPRSSRHSQSPASGTRAVPGKRALESVSTGRVSKSKRRGTTPRLRHDDSQIQFATIHSSPTTDREAESQLLTEHQKEVRERQKQNETLFTSLRSSPRVKADTVGLGKSSLRSQAPKSPELPDATTPDPDGRFDNYVASTPTPRRGHLAPMPELGNDLPSSPPEPRGNPLADEIRSRSASNSIRDEWQGFSSSPIVGSPNPARIAGLLTPSRPTRSLAGVALPVPVVEAIDGMEDDVNPTDLAGDELHSLTPEEEVIEDSLLGPHSDEDKVTGMPVVVTDDAPLTPKGNKQPAQLEETPKSGDEVFMDALSSPQQTTPARRTRASRATRKHLEAMEGERGGPSKLVVELNAKNVHRRNYQVSNSSPASKGTRDVATVGNTSKKTRKLPSRKAKSSPARPTVPSSRPEEAVHESIHPKGRLGQKKRKRGMTKTMDPDAEVNKKRRQRVVSEQADELPVSDASALDDDPDVSKVDTEQDDAAPQYAAQAAGRVESLELSVEIVSTHTAAHDTQSEIVVQTPVEDVDETMECAVLTELSISSEKEGEKPIASKQVGAEMDGLVMGSVIAEEASARVDIAAARRGSVVAAEAEMDGAQDIRNQLLHAMQAMRAAKLSREEVYKIEDIMMDFKRELYEAERRGRGYGA